MNALDRFHYRLCLKEELLAGDCAAGARHEPNREVLAGLVAGRAAGLGCLPRHLGLGEAGFADALARYFPRARLSLSDGAMMDLPEWEDLRRLLLDSRAGNWASETWIVDIMATACAGRDHLWQDLGLGNRAELSHMIRLNFPGLFAANTGDMKWKKFFYKQFCARDGVYVCPAPSCGECSDRPKCFGPEE